MLLIPYNFSPHFDAGRGLRRPLRGCVARRGQDVLHPLRALCKVHRRGGRKGRSKNITL